MEIFKSQQKNREVEALKKMALGLDLPASSGSELKARVMKAVWGTPQDRAVFLGAATGRQRVWLPRFVFAAVVGFVVLGGSVVASADSLSGDILYPIKQAKERLELQLAFEGRPKAMVMTKHARERLRELSVLKAAPAEEILKHQKEVRNQANVQVNAAVESLSRVRQELEDKGNVQAAESVDDTLTRLVTDAKKEDIQLRRGNQDKEDREDVKKEEFKPDNPESKPGTQKRKRTETGDLLDQNSVFTPSTSASSTLPEQVLPEESVYGTSTLQGGAQVSRTTDATEQEQQQTEQQKQEPEKQQEEQGE